MAIIAKAAFQNETFREVVKTPYYIVPKTNITDEERWLNNHHKMILQGSEYYEGCLGGKTGYTEKAGNTLVTYAERNGRKLVLTASSVLTLLLFLSLLQNQINWGNNWKKKGFYPQL